MYPARWAFRKHESEPTTEVAIRRGFAEDVYLVHAGADLATQAVSLEIVINPLINWIWVGFAVVAIGTGIALLPEQAFAFAAARVPAGAVTTSLMLVMLLGLGRPAAAQMTGVEGMTDVQVRTSYQPRSEFERQLQKELVCYCGCGHVSIGECRKDACGTGHQMRAELAAMIDEGRNHDEIVQAFVTNYGGQHILGAPIDEGFNRLIWMFPYALAGISLVGLALVARRWSRQNQLTPASAGDAPAVDAAMSERLDDELRDLD
jgi:cytochrome c-type biogenesis protein CcmF